MEVENEETNKIGPKFTIQILDSRLGNNNNNLIKQKKREREKVTNELKS
jgi:hypothetical protein